MDPVTHVLSSIALSRAGLDRTTRLAMPMLAVSGLAADIDWLSYAGGAGAYLRYNRALGHSLLGSTILVFLIATLFWLLGRRQQQKEPLRFPRVFIVCAVGAAAHLLLDLCNSDGVRLFWPFSLRGFAWDLLAPLDLWLLIFLGTGLLLPGLFSLVSEEIGELKRRRGPRKGVIIALALVVLYVGGQGVLHKRATELLLSREYHAEVPSAAGALPSPTSPLEWRGVVVTENALEELEVPVGPSDSFDPEHAVTHYKPEASPALEAGEHAPAAERFLETARFPLASVNRLEDGYRFELRDLRMPYESRNFSDVVAVVDLDKQFRVTHQEFVFARALK